MAFMLHTAKEMAETHAELRNYPSLFHVGMN